MINIIKKTPEYEAISSYYGIRTAERSGVPLINHIDEGIILINELNGGILTAKAFCLHPMVQSDEAFVENMCDDEMDHLGVRAVALAVEYRHVANAYLSHRKIKFLTEIALSPLFDIQIMLAADKIQNRKDFELYHEGTHPRSKELAQYFRNWLKRLKISEEIYQELKELLLIYRKQNP